MTDDARTDLEFKRLLHQYGEALTRYVRLRVGGEHSDDVLQDLWEAAWRSRADAVVENAADERVRLLSLARNLTARHRSARRQRIWVQLDQDEAVALGAGVEEQVETRERAAEIRHVLQMLSRRDQEVLHLAFVQRLRHADIAALLGLPTANAASKAVSVARRHFRTKWVAQER